MQTVIVHFLRSPGLGLRHDQQGNNKVYERAILNTVNLPFFEERLFKGYVCVREEGFLILSIALADFYLFWSLFGVAELYSCDVSCYFPCRVRFQIYGGVS